MSWKERIGPVAVFEEDVFIELQRRGLTDFLETQKGFYFDFEVEGVYGTRVDFFYNHPYRYAVFLDGPLHLKSRQIDKDELITKALERRGLTVDRFAYERPSNKRKTEICDRIEQNLKNLKKEAIHP